MRYGAADGGAGTVAPPPRNYHPTPRFARRLEEIRRRDPPGYRRVIEVISRVLLHPEDADGMLHGSSRGLFKKYVGRSDYRIAYTACRECRKANLHLTEACPGCAQIPDDSVVFHELYRKNQPPPR